MTDIDTIRKLLEKLKKPYLTTKREALTVISTSDTPKITFTFFENGELCSIYNEW